MFDENLFTFRETQNELDAYGYVCVYVSLRERERERESSELGVNF